MKIGVAYLGCEIIGRTAERPHGGQALLRESEIGDLDVSVEVEQDVLGLEVPVDDVVVVEVVKRERDLCCVEFCYRVGEALRMPSAPSPRQSLQGRGALTLDRRRSVKSSPPGTKSMTMYRFDVSWKAPQRLMMNGCCTACSIICSLRVCDSCFMRTIFSLLSTLMA